jgi:uncharacterized membrane protein
VLIAPRHEISRLEAFSDAVFAFALTLLVVSLDVPTSYAELMKLMAGFVPFSASFALLTWIWYEHNVFFRKYGLQDPLTATINAALLFVVLFYVYPLKFLFTAAFSFFIPLLAVDMRVTPQEMTRIFAIYGAGFVVLFGLFAMLHLHAYRKRETLNLGPLEVFDLRHAGGSHLVSACVGALATLIALFAPLQLAVFSGFTYFLMGPAHFTYGFMGERHRKQLEARLEGAAAPAVGV